PPPSTAQNAGGGGNPLPGRHIAVPESTVVDWQDHILNLPDRAR
ncbi:hypothetical protein M8371_17560, partial [Klebsiella pneumoniae]|nr:hypothetical protein [Klebsiella pneumoniae]